MKFACIQAEKANFPVGMMCRCLEVSRSGFYAWLNRPESNRTAANARLLLLIRDAFARSRKTYGSPRVHAELRALGHDAGKNRVAKLMREAGLAARRRKRFARKPDTAPRAREAPNLLARAFHVARPNTVWAGDMTFIATKQGWVFLAVVMDLHSRRVVGWAVHDYMHGVLAAEALQMALERRAPPAGLLHHSDRGVQYASEEFQRVLVDNQVRCSMSRVGDCWDNAVVESFFSTLKTEAMQGGQAFVSRAEARSALFEYIEAFYNRQRRHSSLGYVSPAEFEETRSKNAA